MPYAEELPDPAANARGIRRRDLWTHVSAQEFTAVSPAMHEEFLLRYQRPIMDHFGLVAYGFFKLSDMITPLRVSRDHELEGLDGPQMGALGYPDFTITNRF